MRNQGMRIRSNDSERKSSHMISACFDTGGIPSLTVDIILRHGPVGIC